MKKVQKYISYAYLVVAVLLFYSGIEQILESDENAWISILFGVLAVFMFFLKRKFAKRYKK